MAHPAGRGQTQRSRPSQGVQQNQHGQLQQGLGQGPGTQRQGVRPVGNFTFGAPSTTAQAQAQAYSQGHGIRPANQLWSTPRAVGQQGPWRGDAINQRNTNPMRPPLAPFSQGGGFFNANSRNAAIPHSSSLSNTQASSHQGTGTTVDEAHQPSLGFSNAYGTDVSIPTSKFNTEAFGPLSVRFIPTSTPQSGISAPTATGAITDEIDETDDLEDLECDFDDDFMLTEVVGNKGSHGPEYGTAMSQTSPSFVTHQPPPSQSVGERVQDISMDELVMLRHRLAETEIKLKSTQEELMIKSGQASVLKDKLETESQAHYELKEKFRTADTQHKSELNEMVEKHRLALENANIKHQFEVQGFLANRPSNVVASSSSQLSRLLPPPPSPTPQFPKSQAGFASTQSSVKVQPRTDDGFSIRNFAGAPRTPKKSRLVAPDTAVEKPRSPQATSESLKTSCQLDTLGDDIPTHTAEEIIRDKLLSGEQMYGLQNLLEIDADAEQVSPLLGSQEYKNNVLLEQLTEACRIALCNLTLVVDEASRSAALEATTNLLQASLIMRKPHHTVNTLQVLTTLYCNYEDLADTICRGSVPFLESDKEDAFKVVPSVSTLPSALACIHYLFLTRVALSPQTSTDPVFPAMREDRKLTKEAEDHMDATLFLLMNVIARHQVASKTFSRTLTPLIRKRIYNTMLELNLEKKNYRTLDQILGIMSIVTREVECSRLFIGWSITEEEWVPSTFSRLGPIIDLLGIQATDPLYMMNGVFPQIKYRTLGILDRFLRINPERTNAIIFQTNLVRTIICLIRDSVELAATMNNHRAMASVWYEKGLQRRDRAGNNVATATATSAAGATMGSISVKLEPLGQRPGAFTFADAQQSKTSMTTANEEAKSSFLSSQKTTSLFSSFQDPMFGQALYKPSTLAKSRTKTMHDGIGSRDMAAHRTKFKTSDYVIVLTVAMELVLRILRSVKGYSKHLCDKQFIEYRTLGYASSKVVVLGLGLPGPVHELAHDLLNEIVLDEDNLEYFLNIVNDKGP